MKTSSQSENKQPVESIGQSTSPKPWADILMWVIFSIVLLSSLIYSFYFSGQNYFDGAIGNLLATIIGIVLAVPAAISIERWRDKIENEKAIKEAANRKKVVLEIITKELLQNKSILDKRLTLGEKQYPHPQLKSISWQAFSSSGEIKWINDPILLEYIANAYHFIQRLNADEEMWYQAEVNRDPRQTWQSAGDRLRKHIVPIYPQAHAAVCQTLTVIASNEK